MSEFRKDEMYNLLNRFFIRKYDRMISNEKFATAIYNGWFAWCNDVIAGEFGGNRKYENFDAIVYKDCLSSGYLVMTN